MRAKYSTLGVKLFTPALMRKFFISAAHSVILKIYPCFHVLITIDFLFFHQFFFSMFNKK